MKRELFIAISATTIARLLIQKPAFVEFGDLFGENS